ncbi:type I-E CRISPR-associated protein Cse2/CasB [Streptomyces sp. YIM S03343]
MTSPTPTTPAPPQQHQRSDRFVAYVYGLCANNRTRAELRRGLGLPVVRCNYLHRYLVPFISRNHGERISVDRRRAYYAVAALIAARPRAARTTEPPGRADAQPAASWYARPNLGAALGEAVVKGILKEGSADSALHLMTRQSADAVHPGLPSLARQLANGGVQLDWAVLLEDLAFWNQYRDQIATRWLESYFRIRDAENALGDTVEKQFNEPEHRDHPDRQGHPHKQDRSHKNENHENHEEDER